jgi:ABC-type transport system substrate-binding protein
MKKTCLIILVTSLVLAGGIITAGCVQTAENNQVQQTGNTLPSVQGTEQQGTSLNPAGTFSGQYHNRSMSNGTRPQLDLASAASKLGVTEQQLSDSLGIVNQSQDPRWNLTSAAQNLGVSEQQIRDALGIPAGNRTRSGGFNATRAQGQ